ncbi:MAG: DUF3078 domain-containing protein [Chitinophagaceae bacterium]
MKKDFVLVISLLCTAAWAYSQDRTIQNLRSESSRQVRKDAADSAVWKLGGLYNLNFNQGALSNWAAGGDNFSMSLTSLLNAFAYYKKGRHSWDNNIDLAYGLVRTTSLGNRKSDDRFDLLSKYGYDIGKKIYLSGLFNIRSQFAKGYTYPTDTSKILISDFFAPAYVVLSVGLDYKPKDNFSLFVSPITARWVIVKNDSLSAVRAFGVDSGRSSKLELGAYASLNFTKNINANTIYKTRLDLFSNYRHDPFNVDIFWTNLLAFKVSRFINMSVSVDVIYDNDVKTVKSDKTEGGAKVQLKQLLSIGFAYKLNKRERMK